MAKTENILEFHFESLKDGIVTIKASKQPTTFKPGDEVLVTKSRKLKSARKKSRIISDIIAQGPIKALNDGKIVIDSSKSFLVPKEVQISQITRDQIVTIKNLSNAEMYD